jgi:hypothetical protein
MGLIETYYSFRRELHERRQVIAAMQLMGRQELHLAGEFAGHIWRHSEGQRLAYTNLGLKGTRRYDLAVLRPGDGTDPTVEALVEVKYVRNRHRAWPNARGAFDEIRSCLSDLADQVDPFVGDEHGNLEVSLRSREARVHALVFVACTLREDDDPRIKSSLFSATREAAKALRLRYHDKPTPQLDCVFEDVDVHALGHQFRVSLSMGLWVSGSPKPRMSTTDPCE